MPIFGAIIIGREFLAVVAGIHLGGETDLFQIACACDTASLLTCRVQGGEQHRRKNGNDRYHDKELDQGENPYFHPAK